MSNFGQLVAIFDFANRAISTGVGAAIKSKEIKGLTKLERLKLIQQADLSKMDVETQRELMRAKMEESARKDALFRDIALYGGLGIGAIALIITLGVMLIKRKGN